MSKLAAAAKEVFETMEARPEAPSSRREAAMRKLAGFSAMAAKVHSEIRGRLAASDREAEWQRVHSYIADVLKDTHVLYAKLARLEGDFAGEELSRLERISEAVLTLGNELSEFSKAFYEGKYDMAESDHAFGGTPPEKGPPVPPEGEAPIVEPEGFGAPPETEEEEAPPEPEQGQEAPQ